MAEQGDVSSARAQARALCRSGAAQSCPDVWLVYAYCELKLNESGALEVCEDVAKRLPNSAAAQLIYTRALMENIDSGSVIQAFSKLKHMFRAAEQALACDPDCHMARTMLVLLYGVPKLVGGDEAKQESHLLELARRSHYNAILVKGMLEVRRNNPAAAISYYEEAVLLDPKDRHPVILLINVKSERGDYVGAFDLCAQIKPEFTGDLTGQAKFVELSAQSLVRVDEALVASREYLETAKGNTPVDQAKVLANTAIILKSIGRMDESKQHMAEARSLWKNVDDHVKKLVKKYHKQGSKVVAR